MTADVVVVAYNSRDYLRSAVEPLAGLDDINVIVIDNNSPDNSTEVIADLAVTVIRNPENAGFARACNLGWQAGSAPYVLFLNPDAQIEAAALRRLIQAVDEKHAGLAAPR